MKQRNYMVLLFLLLVLTILSSSLVVAEDNMQVNLLSASNDFIFQAYEQDFDTCACQTIIQKLTLINTDVFSTKISLSANLDYVIFSSDYVVLEPGQQADVLLRMDIPCDTRGSDALVIQAHSSSNVDKYISQSIFIEKCSNIRVAVYEQSINASLCEPFSSTLRIENNAPFPETYSIDVRPFGEWASLGAQDILIPANSFTDVLVRFDLPCSFYGSQELTYFVTAEQSGYSAKVSQQINLPLGYNFSVDSVSSLSTCQEESNSFPVSITNNENFDQEFTLSSSSPAFAVVNYPLVDGSPVQTIVVPANSSVNLIVSVSPKDFRADDYTFEFEVTESNSGMIASIVVPLSITDCYDLNSFIDIPRKKYVCGGDIFSIPLKLSNAGSEATSVAVTILGPDMISLQDTVYSVDAGSSLDVVIDASIDIDIKESYPILLTVMSNGELINTHKFTLSVDTLEFCHAIRVLDQDVDVRYDVSSFILPVQNKGTRYGTYFVELQNAPEFIVLETTSLDLGRTQKDNLHFSIDQNELRSFLDDKTVQDILGDSFRFQVVVIHDSTLTQYTYDVDFSFTDYPLVTKGFWSVYYTDNCILLFVALSLVTILFLILFFARLGSKRHFVFRPYLLLTLIILILVAAGSLFYTFGCPTSTLLYAQHNVSESSSSHLFMFEDKPLTLDLNNFFSDPDNDILSYAVVDIDQSVLSFELDESSLRLVPLTDWFGTILIYISATDAYNETATSDAIIVEVLPVEDYSFGEIFTILCGYFNLILFVLFCIFLFLTYSLKRKSLLTLSKSKPTIQKTMDKTEFVQEKKAPKKPLTKKVPTKKVPVKKHPSKKKSSSYSSSKKSSSKKSKK